MKTYKTHVWACCLPDAVLAFSMIKRQEYSMHRWDDLVAQSSRVRCGVALLFVTLLYLTCVELVWLASAPVAFVVASCCCFVACFVRLLFACVALAWLLLCAGLVDVLRWFGLLLLLLRLFLRPAAVSLLVSCVCSWLMLRLPCCCFALAWLLF